MNKFNFNFNKGRVDTSLHPFCGGFSNDIRITTGLIKKISFQAFDALMHETGHALYEFGLPKLLKNQLIGKLVCLCMKVNLCLLKMQITKT